MRGGRCQPLTSAVAYTRCRLSQLLGLVPGVPLRHDTRLPIFFISTRQGRCGDRLISVRGECRGRAESQRLTWCSSHGQPGINSTDSGCSSLSAPIDVSGIRPLALSVETPSLGCFFASSDENTTQSAVLTRCDLGISQLTLLLLRCKSVRSISDGHFATTHWPCLRQT